VVRLGEMHKLMHDDVIADRGGEHRNPPMEVQTGGWGAGTPAETEIADLDGEGGDADPSGELFDPVAEATPGVVGVPANEVGPALSGEVAGELEPAVFEFERYSLRLDEEQAIALAEVVEAFSGDELLRGGGMEALLLFDDLAVNPRLLVADKRCDGLGRAVPRRGDLEVAPALDGNLDGLPARAAAEGKLQFINGQRDGQRLSR
jgi:hypothetical protein